MRRTGPRVTQAFNFRPALCWKFFAYFAYYVELVDEMRPYRRVDNSIKIREIILKKLLLAAAAIIVAATGAHAATITGNTTAFSPSNSNWKWDGTEHQELRAALANPANFGPGGTVSEPVSLVTLPDITAATLASVDVFVASWWYDFDAAPYIPTVIDWFLAGGNLLVLADAPSFDPINEALGLPTIYGNSGSTTVSGSLDLGPFGSVGTVAHVGDYGYLDSAAVSANGGDVFGTDAAGRVTIAGFAEGSFGPTSGRLLIMTDVDLISGFYGSADYAPLNAKGRLGLNAVDYLLTPASIAPVPLPAGAVLLITGVGGLSLLRRRKA